MEEFQFTRAGERATVLGVFLARILQVSIHARWGARDRTGRKPRPSTRFQFTRAGERATLHQKDRQLMAGFNSRALGSARPSANP